MVRMKEIRPIDLYTAEQLIDFSGGRKNALSFASQQLEGAVALHNLLASEGFAYIADEVGMGKTYVALGTIALLRHFNPGLRVLYIVPKENLQRKWLKEMRNFVANNWRVVDHRVKSFQNTIATQVVSCTKLLDLVKETAINANRDFLVRMTSFSLPLSEKTSKWYELRRQICDQLPWLPESALDLRNKSAFKDTFARAVNAVLPRFDLLVIDEAHNLKHGFGLEVSSRNRLIGLVLGHEDEAAPYINGGMIKVERVLALSATPIETTFRELWNQMDVLCQGGLSPELRRDELEDAPKKQIAARFLVRRVADLKINGLSHTKNMYRREWRAGGVSVHDNPMKVADVRQRLIVALIQKKVAEVFQKTGRDFNGHFSRSFQIGMLSSFESFLQTAKVAKVESEDSEDAMFDQDEQARNSAEKQGLDTPSIEAIARAYESKFSEPMPHPKMDAVASQLWDWMFRGEKSLVFVRRIASVKELRDKVAHLYDKWLYEYLRTALKDSSGVLSDLDKSYWDYLAARARRELRETKPQYQTGNISDRDEAGTASKDDDTGGIENFFAWFFRGEGPPGLVSGASFRKIRLGSEGAVLSTFFEDNYIAYVLGLKPGIGEVFKYWKTIGSNSLTELRDLAFRVFRRSRQKKFPRHRVYLAYQEAALRLLMSRNDTIGETAKTIIEERFTAPMPEEIGSAPDSFPTAEEFLDAATFFTELEARPSIAEILWPQSSSNDSRTRFRAREQYRELLASVISLGHPIVDLWILAVSGLPSLRRSAGEHSDQTVESLANAFLDLLQKQRTLSGMNSWRELEALGKNVNLVINVNFSELESRDLPELPGYYRPVLQRQTPVGGMWGGFNQQLVSQFRMPGYPYVLITTDVVQEGEDLHTFCSRVVHYGITWTPSAMEQRTGRVDRIGSLAHRRLDYADGVTEADFLQVFFPYLPDTVEFVQVQEVFRRMNKFLDLMHESIRKSDVQSSFIDLTQRIVQSMQIIPAYREPLKSSFGIRRELLDGFKQDLVSEYDDINDAMIRHFNSLLDSFSATWTVEWIGKKNEIGRYGIAHIAGDGLLRIDQTNVSARKQDFFVELKTSAFGGHILFRCSSPAGKIDQADSAMIDAIFNMHRKIGKTKLCAALHDDGLALTAECNILFHPLTTQTSEIEHAIHSSVMCADELEGKVWEMDADTGNWHEQEEEESE